MKHKDIKLKIKYVREEAITPYVNNPVHHSRQEIEALKSSIAEFGMIDPILVHDSVIVAGHARYEAMKELGYSKFPIIELDHLNDAQRKALVIAHNKLGAEPQWDNEKMELIVAELKLADYDIELTGFAEFELEDLFDADIEVDIELPPEKEKESEHKILISFESARDKEKAASEIEMLLSKIKIDAEISA